MAIIPAAITATATPIVIETVIETVTAIEIEIAKVIKAENRLIPTVIRTNQTLIRQVKRKKVNHLETTTIVTNRKFLVQVLLLAVE